MSQDAEIQEITHEDVAIAARKAGYASVAEGVADLEGKDMCCLTWEQVEFRSLYRMIAEGKL